MAPRKHYLENQKFGRLLVLSFIPGGKWNCLCDCGNSYTTDSYNLVNGYSKSCGCLNRDPTIKPSFKHGMYKTPEYAAYSAMKERCLNPRCKAFSYYGGRGIKVCDRWLGKEGFQRFLEDVGMKSSSELELDRINNDGNYEPGNVRWTTHQEQMKNRRKDYGKPERSRQALLTYWSRFTPEQRAAEIKRRNFTTKKENKDVACS